MYGDRSEDVMQSSQEAAIICNILSMSFLQKGNASILQLNFQSQEMKELSF